MIKYMRFVLVSAVIAATMGFAPTVSSAAESPLQGVVAGGGYRQYLDGAATTSLGGASQCTKQMHERVGHWLCPNNARVWQARSSAAPNSSGSGWYCAIDGCWDVYGTAKSDYYGSGEFGFGGTVIGSAYFHFDVSLNGGQSASKPVTFYSTAETGSLVMEGDRLYYSARYPGGNQVDHGSRWSFFPRYYALPAYDTAYWSPNGYVAYENTVQTGSVVHEWVWTVPGYPGSWYYYAKSVKFNKTRSGYSFGSATYLGRSPTGSGWKP